MTMRLFFATAAVAFLAVGVLVPGEARGDLHTWDVNEIFSSADGTIQYIEMQERDGQNNQQRLSSSLAFPAHTIKSTANTYTFSGPGSIGPTTEMCRVTPCLSTRKTRPRRGIDLARRPGPGRKGALARAPCVPVGPGLRSRQRREFGLLPRER